MEAGADVVITIGIGNAHVGIQGIGIINDELACLAIVRLLDEGNLHAMDEVVVIAVHVKEVHQVGQVTHGVYMAVEIAVHVTEGVVQGMTFLDGTQAAHRLNGARQVGKTTFLMQYALEKYGPDDRRCLYINMNHFYIYTHSLR